MRQFTAFVIKEARHILRDKRTMLILFGMPVVLMLLFGFAIRNDVRNVRTVVVTSSVDGLTRQIVDALDASEYFSITRAVATPAAAERLLRRQQADVAIVFSPNFAGSRHRDAGMQVLADASDPNMALQYANYIEGIVTPLMAAARGGSVAGYKPAVIIRMLYNSQMLSAYNFVPGIMGMLLLLICAMMTSVSIAREKERGTMEVLLVSPVRPLNLILAKAVPYMCLSVIILVSILLMSYYVLDVPLAGSVFWIFMLSLLYILLALSLGLLISNVANSQLMALLLSAMVLLLPTVLLSGMIFPIGSMPRVLQWISCIVPARWYIAAMRKLMIMGVGIGNVLREALVLVLMTVVLLSVSLVKFKTRLE
ncbi:ABC transporter permease [Prevotella sp. kh1p2]|uniref:ABC transporter permease n=1 Tax=Prevotella sp. kh1p2 TaxID=1761883 RepID=UPI0008D34B9A|nr:ABC transporter permease [Prevotella sp. kh1p2]SET09991.1 ABC-2 type transport system permease protein [Prevotella sp. kh1p2]SNU11877.1 ABC-2 type transport system permease protein [Prevotellaceae bacterium KH2P17]